MSISRSSAGRLAAWRISVEQAFGGVIPEVVTAVRHGARRYPLPIHILPLLAVAIVVPMFGAGLGPIDDHEIPVLQQRIADAGPLETLLSTDEGNGRFRPAYWLARLTEVAVWGQNANGWYLNRLLLALAAVAAGFALARRWLPVVPAVLASALMLVGPQAEAFARLGPQEAYAVPLTLAGFALIGRDRSSGLVLTTLAAFTKEPFVLAAVMAAAWAWWRGARLPASLAAGAAFVAVIGIVVALAGNGGTTEQMQRIGFQVEGRYLYPFVIPVALLAGFAAARFRALTPVLVALVVLGTSSVLATSIAWADETRRFSAIVDELRADGRPVLVHIPNPGYIEYALALRRYLPDVPMQLDASVTLPGFGPIGPEYVEVTLPRT